MQYKRIKTNSKYIVNEYETKYYGIYVQSEYNFETNIKDYYIFDANGNESNRFEYYPTEKDIENFKTRNDRS